MTKPREKNREELQAEIEDGKKKIRQLENREKVLRQKLSQEERRTRSHRLIVRGAVFESIVPEAKTMTDEEAAAYRSGEKLTNEWDGMTHDYTRKGGVVHTEILLPPNTPPSFSDRSTLWNSVELYEKAGNAQLAREIDAALP